MRISTRIRLRKGKYARLADALYRRADWPWAQNGGATVTHGWKPESGFLEYRWEGYDEALVLYILGLGSPTHPLPEESYAAWASTYEWKNSYGYDYLYAGPLFTHQISHVWIDFRGIRDAFMRDKRIDYFENTRRATYVQQRYAIDNPLEFAGYGKDCWGITASDGPGPDTIKVNGIERRFFDYVGRGVPYGPDDGTHRAVGRGGVAAVRAGDRVAGNRLSGARGRPENGQPLRLQGDVQSDLPGQVRQSLWLDIAVALRDQPGADQSDDRELPNGSAVAPDAELPLRRRRVATSGIHRRLVMTRYPISRMGDRSNDEWIIVRPRRITLRRSRISRSE